jgi:probable HAF family extracellular repeat protein
MTLSRRTAVAAVAVLASFAGRSASVRAAARFRGLVHLPGGTRSSARAVSADGSVVVGADSNGAAWQAVRWGESGSVVGLDLTGGDLRGAAADVSADGAIIVGRSDRPFDVIPVTEPFPQEAFRWTGESGAVGMGYLAGRTRDSSAATGVSADGTAIVGQSYAMSQMAAFRWTDEGGMEDLGRLPDGDSASASGVSADGSVVVGYGFDWDDWIDPPAYSVQAFRWTESTGPVGLGFLGGGEFNLKRTASQASAVSADGTVIVGFAYDAGFPIYVPHDARFEAFRWTEADGMVGLGKVSTDNYSSARAVSADGSVIVGQSAFVGEVNSVYRAFIWTEADGMRSLREWLVTECGLDLTGWTLEDATGISADGTIIVGNGINPDGQSQAWVATIPEPATVWLLSFALLPLARRRPRGEAPSSRGLRQSRPTMAG